MEWRNVEIEGFQGIYQASPDGLIRSLDRAVTHNNGKVQHRKGVILKPGARKGYQYVVMRNKDNNKTFLLHRLIAMIFIPNPDNKPEVNHKDGNKANNRVDNLEWATKLENTQHAIDTGLLSGEMMKISGERGKKYGIEKCSKMVGKFNGSVLLDSYYSIREAVRQNNYKTRSCVSACCNGKVKTAHGYDWKFI